MQGWAPPQATTENLMSRKPLTKDEQEQLHKATRDQLPKYKCHKEVLATKIAKIEYGYDQLRDRATILLHPEDSRLAGIEVPQAFMSKHNPVAPGYFVVYNAGTDKHYESWSPVDVFEDGYTLVGDAKPELATDLLAQGLAYREQIDNGDRHPDEDAATAIDGERGG